MSFCQPDNLLFVRPTICVFRAAMCGSFHDTLFTPRSSNRKLLNSFLSSYTLTVGWVPRLGVGVVWVGRGECGSNFVKCKSGGGAMRRECGRGGGGEAPQKIGD